MCSHNANAPSEYFWFTVVVVFLLSLLPVVGLVIYNHTRSRVFDEFRNLQRNIQKGVNRHHGRHRSMHWTWRVWGQVTELREARHRQKTESLRLLHRATEDALALDSKKRVFESRGSLVYGKILNKLGGIRELIGNTGVLVEPFMLLFVVLLISDPDEDSYDDNNPRPIVLFYQHYVLNNGAFATSTLSSIQGTIWFVGFGTTAFLYLLPLRTIKNKLRPSSRDTHRHGLAKLEMFKTEVLLTIVIRSLANAFLCDTDTNAMLINQDVRCLSSTHIGLSVVCYLIIAVAYFGAIRYATEMMNQKNPVFRYDVTYYILLFSTKLWIAFVTTALCSPRLALAICTISFFAIGTQQVLLTPLHGQRRFLNNYRAVSMFVMATTCLIFFVDYQIKAKELSVALWLSACLVAGMMTYRISNKRATMYALETVGQALSVRYRRPKTVVEIVANTIQHRYPHLVCMLIACKRLEEDFLHVVRMSDLANDPGSDKRKRTKHSFSASDLKRLFPIISCALNTAQEKNWSVIHQLVDAKAAVLCALLHERQGYNRQYKLDGLNCNEIDNAKHARFSQHQTMASSIQNYSTVARGPASSASSADSGSLRYTENQDESDASGEHEKFGYQGSGDGWWLVQRSINLCRNTLSQNTAKNEDHTLEQFFAADVIRRFVAHVSDVNSMEVASLATKVIVYDPEILVHQRGMILAYGLCTFYDNPFFGPSSYKRFNEFVKNANLCSKEKLELIFEHGTHWMALGLCLVQQLFHQGAFAHTLKCENDNKALFSKRIQSAANIAPVKSNGGATARDEEKTELLFFFAQLLSSQGRTIRRPGVSKSLMNQMPGTEKKLQALFHSSNYVIHTAGYRVAWQLHATLKEGGFKVAVAKVHQARKKLVVAIAKLGAYLEKYHKNATNAELKQDDGITDQLRVLEKEIRRLYRQPLNEVATAIIEHEMEPIKLLSEYLHQKVISGLERIREMEKMNLQLNMVGFQMGEVTKKSTPNKFAGKKVHPTV